MSLLITNGLQVISMVIFTSSQPTRARETVYATLEGLKSICHPVQRMNNWAVLYSKRSRAVVL
ncbi:hypothetical protein H6CHR_03122 [Variovorax sp. PBL-H6]|nr:hypothetical protein H6CHR_03122 [Variovorax sp. PBL-H6]